MDPVSCCDIGDRDRRCVFAKALAARAARCECAARRSLAEGEWIECLQPVARGNCAALLATLHERARFALKLPGPGRPLLHVQAMRLQCGGLLALRDELDHPACDDGDDTNAVPTQPVAAGLARTGERGPDVHQLSLEAHARFPSFGELPWRRIVAGTAAWTPRRRRAGTAQGRSVDE
jgi:hypothetical protein